MSKKSEPEARFSGFCERGARMNALVICFQVILKIAGIKSCFLTARAVQCKKTVGDGIWVF